MTIPHRIAAIKRRLKALADARGFSEIAHATQVLAKHTRADLEWLLDLIGELMTEREVMLNTIGCESWGDAVEEVACLRTALEQRVGMADRRVN